MVRSQRIGAAVIKPTSPRSGLARLPETELVRTYVWEKPVRIAHWLIFFAIISLSFTGLYIHRPFLLSSGNAAFLMAKMRFVHVVSGFVLIAAFIFRFYWFFRGNFWSRWSAYIPIRREQWQGIGNMLEFYSFLRFNPGLSVGHNPLAALSYFFIYLFIVVEILTGLALYDQVLHNPVLHQFIGWLPLLIETPIPSPDSLLADVRVLRVCHLPRLRFDSGFERRRKRTTGQYLLGMEICGRRRAAP